MSTFLSSFSSHNADTRVFAGFDAVPSDPRAARTVLAIADHMSYTHGWVSGWEANGDLDHAYLENLNRADVEQIVAAGEHLYEMELEFPARSDRRALNTRVGRSLVAH